MSRKKPPATAGMVTTMPRDGEVAVVPEALGITVGEVLALPELKGVELVAGRAGLDRVVTDVSVLEVPFGFRRWLRGHELMLSTLHAQDDPLRCQVEVIEELNAAGVAGFGLHPGIHGITPYEPALARADELAMPFLLLPEHFPYARVIHAVLSEMLNRQALTLRRSTEVERALLDRVRNGAYVQRLVSDLVDLLERPVALLTRRGVPLAAASPHGEGDLLAQLLAPGEGLPARNLLPPSLRRTVTEHGHMVDSPLEVGELRLLQTTVTVQAYDQVIGFLVTWDRPRALEAWERMALRHAATAVALADRHRHGEAADATRALEEFLSLLARGDALDVDTVTRRAAHLGIDLSHPRFVLIIEPDRWPRGTFGRASLETEPWSQRLLTTVRTILREHQPEPLVATRGDHLLALLAVPRHLPAGELERWGFETAENLRTRLMEFGFQVTLGLSGACTGARQLMHGTEEAEHAAWIGTRLLGPGATYCSQHLWFYNTMVQANRHGFMDPAWRRLIENLLAEDEKSGGQLLRTLDVFLDCQQSFADAARKLFVHPNTVRYRVDKVRDILGPRALEDPTLRVAHHLAIKAARLFGGEKEIEPGGQAAWLDQEDGAGTETSTA
ncbi:MAG TPA: PucR family transcriptional regulator ligand-binding domain-containing protein [Bacillota bacterium]